MRTVRLSEAVWSAIAQRGNFGETEDDVLRRVFELPARDLPATTTAKGRRVGRGGVKHSTKRVSPKVMSGTLHLDIEGGLSTAFALPGNKSDVAAIRQVRGAAHTYARDHGATQGQLDAITKELNKAGYYTRGPRSLSPDITY